MRRHQGAKVLAEEWAENWNDMRRWEPNDAESVSGTGEWGTVRTMSWKIAAAVMALALSACSTTGSGGTGSSVQAFAEPSRSSQSATQSASQPVGAAIVEAMGGGLIGSVGQDLDARDRRRALEAEYRALEYMPAGQAASWGDRGRRRHGEVVAGSPYRVGSQDCRQYSHTVNAGGRSQTARGTACRNADGSWTPLV